MPAPVCTCWESIPCLVGLLGAGLQRTCLYVLGIYSMLGALGAGLRCPMSLSNTSPHACWRCSRPRPVSSDLPACSRLEPARAWQALPSPDRVGRGAAAAPLDRPRWCRAPGTACRRGDGWASGLPPAPAAPPPGAPLPAALGVCQPGRVLGHPVEPGGEQLSGELRTGAPAGVGRLEAKVGAACGGLASALPANQWRCAGCHWEPLSRLAHRPPEIFSSSPACLAASAFSAPAAFPCACLGQTSTQRRDGLLAPCMLAPGLVNHRLRLVNQGPPTPPIPT